MKATSLFASAVADFTQAIGPLSVLFLMASDMEYGDHLKTRIRPLFTGFGPVEAAVTSAAALGELENAGRRPDLVFSLGSAGSRSLEHAAVYQVSSVSYRDMDASPFGFEKGVTPFIDEPAVVEIPYRIRGVPTASIATGASIVSGSGYDAVKADMVDMESFAVFRAARRFGIPMIGLRGISDGRTDITGLHDWTDYLHLVDERLAEAFDRFSADVESGHFKLDV